MAGNTEILVQNLTYSHNPSEPPSLSGINISLSKGSRTLLIGANGGVLSASLRSDQRQRFLTLVFISRQVNTASNSSRQAASHIKRGTNPNKGVRCFSQFPFKRYVSRHGMGSALQRKRDISL
jgi:hypothetical protein